jgi:hypothetical protein
MIKFEAETDATLDRSRNQYQSLTAEFSQRGYDTLSHLQPQTRALDFQSLMIYFDASIFQSKLFVISLRKLAKDFAKSHE